MLYRVLEALRVGNQRIPKGTIDELKMLSSKCIEALLAKSRISEVHPPPLAILPGWKERAEAYAMRGVENVVDLVDDQAEEADVEEALQWVRAPSDSHIGGGPLAHSYVWEFDASDAEAASEVEGNDKVVD